MINVSLKVFYFFIRWGNHSTQAQDLIKTKKNGLRLICECDSLSTSVVNSLPYDFKQTIIVY